MKSFPTTRISLLPAFLILKIFIILQMWSFSRFLTPITNIDRYNFLATPSVVATPSQLLATIEKSLSNKWLNFLFTFYIMQMNLTNCLMYTAINLSTKLWLRKKKGDLPPSTCSLLAFFKCLPHSSTVESKRNQRTRNGN